MKKRFVPKDSEELIFDEISSVVYCYQDIERDTPAAIGYIRNRSKPDFHFQFSNDRQRDSYISEWVENLSNILKQKIAKREKSNAFEHDYEVGDILCDEWGWDQSNVDFYQVVAVKTKKTIMVRKLEKNSKPAREPMCEWATPMLNYFSSDEVAKRVLVGGCIKTSSFSYAFKWNGKPKRSSWDA